MTLSAYITGYIFSCFHTYH